MEAPEDIDRVDAPPRKLRLVVSGSREYLWSHTFKDSSRNSMKIDIWYFQTDQTHRLNVNFVRNLIKSYNISKKYLW